MSNKAKGIIAGIIAAVCYGTNPLGVLYLYQGGLNTVSTVFYRYLAAIVILAVVMLFKGVSVNRTKIKMDNFKMTFFVAVFALLLFVFYSFFDADNHLQLLPDMKCVFWAAFLGLFPYRCLVDIYELVYKTRRLYTGCDYGRDRTRNRRIYRCLRV